MSIYSSGQYFTGTIQGASSVDTVVLTAPGYSVKVTNNSGTSPIYWTADSPWGSLFAPTVGGHGTLCSASVAGASTNVRGAFMYGAVIQLISAGTPQYSIEMQSARATD